MSSSTSLIVLLSLSLAACSRPAPHLSVDIRAAVATAPVSDDPDDPAIWIHPSDPGQSLVVGTNKVAAPKGALVVFGLDGKTRQTISGLDRPNNVDVEYGLLVGRQPTDIAVVTERLKNRLRIFKIPRDGAVFAIISPKTGPSQEYLWEYRLEDDGAGRVKVTKVRRFGR